MIARRKEAFIALCRLLRDIEHNPEDIASVRALNRRLIKEIMRDEGHVLRHRARLKELNRELKVGRPSKIAANQIRREINRQELAVNRYTDQIFIWKSIGDALAYAYIDTFSIKHVFFDTETTGVRPDAGFMTGKSGLAREIEILEAVLDHGAPAVLCDVTNILRHGDICLLIGSDPFLIEVKSSPGLNQRGQRQRDRLKQLSDFLLNDGATNFRGLPSVSRRTMSSEPRDCLADINLCIESAWRSGYNMVCPERGLVYLAVYGELPDEDLFEHLGMRVPIAFLLNSDKNDCNWAPYLPFINSVRDVERLFDFVAGHLSIIVLVDGAQICDDLTQPGYRVSLIEDDVGAVLLEHLDSGARVIISRQFLGRLGFEFLSPRWFVEHERDMVSAFFQDLARSEGSEADAIYAHAAQAQFSSASRRYSVERAADGRLIPVAK